MKILDRHVLGSFFTAFALTFVLLSFVLTIDVLGQIAKCVVGGSAALPVFRYAGVCFTETLQWSVPLALLFSSVLVFSRLASDNELMALQTSGVGIGRIVRAPLAFSIVLAIAAAYLNCEVLPREHEAKRKLRQELLSASLLKKVAPGGIVSVFRNFKFTFDAWTDGEMVNLQAWERDRSGENRLIRASRAGMSFAGEDAVFVLKDVTVESLCGGEESVVSAARLRYVLRQASRKLIRRRDRKDMCLGELLAHLRDCRGQVDRMIADGRMEKSGLERLGLARLTLSLRFVYATASVVFVLAGIPFGFLCRRRHSSLGFLAALAAAFGFYLPIVAAQTLADRLALRPDLLVWIPAVVLAGLGVGLMRRFR